MNWAESDLRGNWPVNMSLVETFQKAYQGKWTIVFQFAINTVEWTFSTEDNRNDAYDALVDKFVIKNF